MKKLSILLFLVSLMPLCAAAFNDNTGEKGNMVCFVRFADEEEDIFENSLGSYETLFNGEGDETNSVYNYFRLASYGKLQWKSRFYPATEGRIKSYRTKYERAYYQKYDATLHPTGYDSDVAGEARMQALVREIAAFLSADVKDGSEIDTDNDGFVDNLCIIFSGRSELSAKRGILWPQRKDLALPDEKAIYIAGKKLSNYIMVFDGANGYDAQFNGIRLNTGVLCHEMSHSLGTYDLYHASGSLNPVGVWDLMSDNQASAQNMTAYTKFRYCKWISEIPEISEPGTYTLSPLGGKSSDRIAYRIKPVGSDEYFVVEYRKKEGFDSNLPASGLLVYRICPQYTGGNVNYNGSTRLDEQYIFRPGGTLTADGEISKAALGIDNGRPAFGGEADIRPFYSDGGEAPFAITDISACGETLTFTLQPMDLHLVADKSEVSIAGFADCSASVNVSSTEPWQLSGLPEWLHASITSAEGTAEVVFTTVSDNDSSKGRSAGITVSSASSEVKITVTQQSKSVTAPSALTAKTEAGAVRLAWNRATAGERIIYDDFENTDNPNGWEVKTSGDRGWRWEKCTTTKGYYRSYAGNYAATVYYAWDDVHQDEYFTSKAFADGKTLAFYSRTNSAGATPKDPQYYNVEVSSDNGATWTAIFNALTDQTKATSGKYTRITLDLTPYQSGEMRVRFHCYDTNNLGLSYYWQIENLEIVGESSMKITGYDIYRNGEKIAHTDAAEYVDTAPAEGHNVYAVCATGDFGESSMSESVAVDFSSTGIESAKQTSAAATVTYNLMGRRTAGLRHGLNIIRMADGKTAKVIVK